MASLKNVLVLAMMLLLSQIIIAVHDIHCIDEEHDQTCEIYLAHDHSANNNADQKLLEPVVYGQKPNSFISLASPTFSVPPYLSRAPPHIYL